MEKHKVALANLYKPEFIFIMNNENGHMEICGSGLLGLVDYLE